MESEARLQEGLTVGSMIAFDWDLRTGLSWRSENAAKVLGFDPQQPITAAQFLARVHPDDCVRYKEVVRDLRPDHPSYVVLFRFTRFDGREIWLEEAAKAEFEAKGRCVRLKGLTRDITDRKRAEESQSLLIAELDHRVKNVLARVGVVAMYTRESSSSMDEFVKALDGRIKAMADAHALLSQSQWHGVALIELIQHQLAPYTTEENTTIGGPDVELAADAIQALAMVLQELVTNSVKYGALSAPAGRVSVTWDRRPSGKGAASVMIEWREMGGPPVSAPFQPGYGTSLIRDLIPHELGGRVNLVLASDGACCEIEIPLE